MTPVMPADWLPILAQRLDANAPRVQLLRRYREGDAPLPEMGKNVRASWQRFQKQSRTNLATLITNAVAERLVPNGVDVGSGDSPELSAAVRRIWRDSRMQVVAKDAIRGMLDFRTSYMVAWAGDDGKALITAESSEMMFAAWEPLQPWKVRAALKWWRDSDAETDYAMVWSPVGWQLFSRSVWVNPTEAASKRIRNNRCASTGWTPTAPPTITGEAPPVVILDNPDGAGEFELHLDQIDRIHSGILERRSTSAMQAWRQRGIKGGLPRKDADGNDIDWASVFEPAPGALWDIPEGLDIWESQPTDFRQMLDQTKEDLRELSAATRTPLPMLIPDSQNQSATGAAAAKEGLVLKARDRLEVADVAIGAILSKALRIEGLETDETVRVSWEPPDHVSLSEKYAAAAQAKAAGESWPSIARNILGYSPEQIAQDMQERAADALLFGAPPANDLTATAVSE